MKPIDAFALQDALIRLLHDSSTLSSDIEARPEQLEKIARAISVHVKALTDIAEYNEILSYKEGKKKYSRYEDIPPPSPEERARFVERLYALIDKVDAESEEAEASDTIFR